MRWLRLVYRIFGWLLTPFLAWAASFFGAVAGALIAMRIEDPVRGLAVTVVSLEPEDHPRVALLRRAGVTATKSRRT